MRRSFKKGGAGRHVQLPEWLQVSEAWQDLKPGPRALYVELKRRYNGANNGEIYLSHRDASKALNVNRKTVSGFFASLVDHGFLIVTKGHCLGPSGTGQSATYALAEHPIQKASATKEFMRWKKQKPRPKITHSLAQKTDMGGVKITHLENQMRKKRAALVQNHPSHVGKKRAIYISSHVPQEETGKGKLIQLPLSRGLCGKAAPASEHPTKQSSALALRRG